MPLAGKYEGKTKIGKIKRNWSQGQNRCKIGQNNDKKGARIDADILRKGKNVIFGGGGGDPVCS
jgi:hypothetical protein